jgi:AcrR family transcriptional regulator
LSPRPRTITDEALLTAVHRVVNRLGPHLTLADVAKEAGVSPAMLVQRFGSKRGLLLAFASLAAEGTDEEFAAIRQKYPDPLDAIREFVRCFAQMASSPEAVSNGLAFLQVDLSDPEFHQYSLAQARATLAEIKKLLDAAVKDGILVRCETAKLAFALNAIVGGAMVSWAVLRDGTAEHAMQEAVDTLIRPYLTPTAAKRKRSRAQAPRRTFAR